MTKRPDYARYGRRRLMKGAGLAGLAGLAGCIGTGDPESESGGNGGDDGSDESGGDDGSDGSGGDDGGMASEIDVWGWDVAARALMITAEEYESENDATVSVEEFGRGAMKDRLQRTSSRVRARLRSPCWSPLMVHRSSRRDPSHRSPTRSGRRASAMTSSPGSGRRSPSTERSTRSRGTPVRPRSTTDGRCTTSTTSTRTASETWADFIEEGQKLPDDQYMLQSSPEGDLSGVWRYQFRQLSGESFPRERRGEHSQRDVAPRGSQHQGNIRR